MLDAHITSVSFSKAQDRKSQSECNVRVFEELIVQLDPAAPFKNGLLCMLEIVIHPGFLFFLLSAIIFLSNLRIPWH